MFAQQAIERRDQTTDRAALAARMSAGIHEHETMVRPASSILLVGDTAEVGDVLRDHGPALLLGAREELGIV
jgi:hypothetical protein